jgi:hypothetical protein
MTAQIVKYWKSKNSKEYTLSGPEEIRTPDHLGVSEVSYP